MPDVCGNRVAVAQKFNANRSGENVEFTSYVFTNYVFISNPYTRIRTKRELYATLLLSNFKDRQHIKVVNVIAVVTCTVWPPTLFRTKYTNRLNPGNNIGVRNVPLSFG